MNHLDLFSGIGGFSLAAQWVWGKDHNIVAFVEKDQFCQKVLRKHWPNVPIHNCIKEYNYDGRPVDILTGGFPCQPFSVAGRKKGTKDDRDLWPEMFRVIQQTKPSWIIGENVANFTNMAFTRTKIDLESQGYTVQPFIIPACAVGAKHKRDRIWIVAYSKGIYAQGQHNRQKERESWRSSWWKIEPNICRVANGIPDRVDRLKSLGNAIVPQVAQVIMEAIKKQNNILY